MTTPRAYDRCEASRVSPARLLSLNPPFVNASVKTFDKAYATMTLGSIVVTGRHYYLPIPCRGPSPLG